MTQKEMAVSCLKKLNVHPDYVRAFEGKRQRLTWFTQFFGFYVDEGSALDAKVKEIERKYGCIVYAVTHEFFEFGECYSFLIVSKYQEDWDTTLSKYGNRYTAFAYVWNKDDDWCSEFGSVLVHSFGGGIARIG